MSRQHANKTAALAAMLTYNLLVTTYLMYLGFGGTLVGILLWPAIAIHAVLTLLVSYVWFNDQAPEQPPPDNALRFISAFGPLRIAFSVRLPSVAKWTSKALWSLNA
jgi:hypothetical protein